MTTATETRLPKYVQECNTILELLSAEPTRSWRKTQRELGQLLGMAQPVLSLRMKMLEEQGKVRKGDPLPVRGKNFIIEVVDPTPFEGRPTAATARHHANDRMMTPEEELGVITKFDDFSDEKIGKAIKRLILEMDEKERRAQEMKSTQLQALRNFRAQLEEKSAVEQRLRSQYELLLRQYEQSEKEKSELRERVNHFIVRLGQKGDRSVVPVTELMDEESKEILRLLKETPGHYRRSDRDVGLTA